MHTLRCIVFALVLVLSPVAWSQRLRLVPQASPSWVSFVAYSPDGRTLASGSMQNTIRLWDVATGRALRTLTGHTSSVFAGPKTQSCLALHTSGRREKIPRDDLKTKHGLDFEPVLHARFIARTGSHVT